MTIITLPPPEAIEVALYGQSERARLSGDDATMRAYDNAAGDFARGARPFLSAGCWMVPSSTRNIYHRVRKEGDAWTCNCEHGLKRGGICRHIALIAAIDAAWVVDDEPLPFDVDAEERRRQYEEACEALNECYA